ncbi:hypothetical protein SERLA73DRAFT_190445 [Serpula lacrymans var. lacrymans S7.3]|uniref:RRM domain-containing protein n=2 Tax=Serpula lacrymans var. lacrymans TaxID=341189 RepID=F8QFN0_SERL3|nr:uncharacterized protein SERLADRAFT_457816 [Serpula lacrymans var. lacrymans S7.9]EGN92864.1 hypothetical protein SERLA73DRAFT_190445 [Serpula lacrymans var. lacrymans S7.3]EGO29696.1 hypothetical protein SERLADRAFT_457816 [Serpula lacrymans var. lacrymans S7.9]
MHAHQRSPTGRFNSYHGPKRQLLGNHAGHVAPAWRTGDITPNANDKQGSKILLSRLPMDVGETEVEDLFKKTVGPLKEVFLIYNSQARSRGMAVVTFQRPGDAAIARAKYDGKFVDGRRPIKIEIIVDSQEPVRPSLTPPTAPSLLNRLGGVAATKAAAAAAVPPPLLPLPTGPIAKVAPKLIQARKPKVIPVNSAAQAVVPHRVRQKKGPRRVKKSLAQLDKEMEDYRAAVDYSDTSRPESTNGI